MVLRRVIHHRQVKIMLPFWQNAASLEQKLCLLRDKVGLVSLLANGSDAKVTSCMQERHIVPASHAMAPH
jgi:hypothetical protein